MRLMLTIPLAALLLGGCATGLQPSRRMVLQPADRLSAPRAGKDLRTGTTAALVSFSNLIYVAGDGGTPTDRIAAEELRDLTDAMTAALAAELLKLPNVEWLPVARLGTNKSYKALPFPQGGLFLPLPYQDGFGRRVAPAGLRSFLPPQANGQRFEKSGIDQLTHSFQNFTGGFEAEMNRLCWALGVDFVVLANARVALKPGFPDGWGAQVELLELCLVGKSVPRAYAFAEVIEGQYFTLTPAAGPDKVSDQVAALLSAPETDYRAGRDYAANRWWRSIAEPYRALAAKFGARLARARD